MITIILAIALILGAMALFDHFVLNLFNKKMPDWAFFTGMVLAVISVPICWVLNLIEVFSGLDDPVSGLYVLRCIGVFVFPLGAILGLV